MLCTCRGVNASPPTIYGGSFAAKTESSDVAKVKVPQVQVRLAPANLGPAVAHFRKK